MSTRSRSSQSGTGTVKFGTVLSSGATASYPTSFASSPQFNPNSPSSDGSKLSAGVIAGIVVACVAFLLLVAFLIFLLLTRRKRASTKSKRLSRTALLPAPATASSGNALQNTPEMTMSQHPNYASTAVTVPAATAAPAHAKNKSRLHMMPGLSFGSGHRRTDSNNSTTPFLGTSPESPTRPSTGDSFEAPRSPTSNRYSLESTTTYPGSPSAPRHSRFEVPQDGMSRDSD